jgi:ElaB/YqjD/DUF883 family membrane-anchored ribosome-binding protein
MNAGAQDTERMEREVAEHQRRLAGTLDELEDRLSPGHLLDEALRGLRRSNAPSNMRTFAENLGRSARDNPVPMTLLGLGLAWMAFSSDQRGDGGGERGRTMGEPGLADDPARYGNEIYERDPEPYGETENPLSEERISAAYAAAESLERQGEESEEAFAHRRDKVRARVMNLRERTGESQEAFRDRVNKAVEDARHRARSARFQARARAERATETASRTFEDQPLLAAAFGVGIGAAIGAMLPTTRAEDERLGRTREQLEEEARRRAEEATREADRRASEAYRAAREQAAGEHAGD